MEPKVKWATSGNAGVDTHYSWATKRSILPFKCCESKFTVMPLMKYYKGTTSSWETKEDTKELYVKMTSIKVSEKGMMIMKLKGTA